MRIREDEASRCGHTDRELLGEQTHDNGIVTELWECNVCGWLETRNHYHYPFEDLDRHD